MEPRRRGPLRDLDGVGREAEGREHVQRVALGVEGVDGQRLLAPVPAGATRFRGPAANARGRHALVLRAIAQKGLADLEQRHIPGAAVGVALGGGDERGKQARAHVGEIGGDRIRERKLGLPAAEAFGLLAADEGPGHGLHQSAGRKRPARDAGAALHGAEFCRSKRLGLRQRRRRHLVEADDAHDLLDEVGLALDVGAPARHGDLEVLAMAGGPEAEQRQRRLHFRGRHGEAGEALHFGDREVDDQVALGNLARDHDLGGLAAADLEDELGREFEARNREGRINAALEAMAGVRMNVERPARARDGERIPERALDQHVDRVGAAARRGAAHDAGERLDARIVGDHAHGVVERIILAVERREAFAGAAAAHHEIALDLGGVEHVQRAAAVEGQVVGDVDERIDRLLADALELALQPFGRGAILDALHHAQREQGRERLRVAEVEADPDRARIGAAHRIELRFHKRADLGRRKIARDAVDAEAVGAVRRDRDLDHRVVEPDHRRERLSDRSVRRQLQNAVGLLGKAEFAARAQHAGRGHAADF